MCPQPEVFCPTAEAGNEFSPAERNLLIQIAHKAILAQLDGVKISSDAPTSHLTEPRGVFTTVYVDGSLRGCVGNVAPKNSLYEAVIETARSAAFEDSRFPPLSREEAAKIEITLSVLSPLELIDTEKIEVGKHGLLVSQGSYRGLLLPQVASEQGWDRPDFPRARLSQGRLTGRRMENWRQNRSFYRRSLCGQRAKKDRERLISLPSKVLSKSEFYCSSSSTPSPMWTSSKA